MNHDVTPAELTLVNGEDAIRIRPRPAVGGNPIACRSWDLGAPDVRIRSVPNPGADGVTESPGFLGSRQVTFELQVLGGKDPITNEPHDAYWYVAKLAKMIHPSSMPKLFVTRLDDTTHGELWYMNLRGNPYSLVYTQRAAAMVEMQLSFTCPSGFLESLQKSFVTQDSGYNDPPATDWIFPATFPKGFGYRGGGTTSAYPQLNLIVGGDAAISPTVYIYGPVTDPVIFSQDVDGRIVDQFKFDGLTLESGDAVGIDMTTGDIWLGEVGSSMVLDDMSGYALVDWSVSTYWVWEPGPHTVVYAAGTGTVTIQYSERRFTI